MSIDKFMNKMVGCGVLRELEDNVYLGVFVMIVEKYDLEIDDDMWYMISECFENEEMSEKGIRDLISCGYWSDDESDELRILWDKMRLFEKLIYKYGVDVVSEKSGIEDLESYWECWRKYDVFKLSRNFDVLDSVVGWYNWIIEMREKFNIEVKEGYKSNEELKECIEKYKKLGWSDEDDEDEE